MGNIFYRPGPIFSQSQNALHNLSMHHLIPLVVSSQYDASANHEERGEDWISLREHRDH